MKKMTLFLFLFLFLSLSLLIPACGRVTPSAESPADATSGAPVELKIEGFAFHPATITIAPGTTVTWINQDSVAHTVAMAGTESPRLNKGDSWSYTFEVAGTFDYICGLHPSMKGQIIIE
ncbi:MAG: cupredoxin family copper-binding protein [Candidatus Binatia bacterium]